MKNKEQTTDRPSVSVKRATVEALLTATKELLQLVNQHAGKSLLEATVDDGFFPMKYDELCGKEKEKMLDLFAESGEKIADYTFGQLAHACVDVMGQKAEETLVKMLQLLGIEVTE